MTTNFPLTALQCVNVLCVCLLWGCTNPLLRKTSSEGPAARDVGWARWAWARKAFLCVFALNQLGSALYAYLLGSLELSLAVPLCNSLTFVVTAVAGYALGENVQHPRMLVAGAVFVVLGTAICMVSSAQGEHDSSSSGITVL
jgi:drug/metabolite transporter (DMT)-like permease